MANMVKDRHSKLAESGFLSQQPSLQKRKDAKGAKIRKQILKAREKQIEIKEMT